MCGDVQFGSSAHRAAQPVISRIERVLKAWEAETSTHDYATRRLMPQKRTPKCSKLERAAQAARRKLARARRIAANLEKHAMRVNARDTRLMGDFYSGELVRVTNKRDVAYVWNKDMRHAAGSAAARL